MVTPAFASTAYLGLQPGLSTRVEAGKVLGPPVLKLADVLHEHKPQDGTGPIYVEYRLGGDVIERIEVKLTGSVNRTDLIAAMRLPQQSVASRVSDGALVEYFADDMAIALTFNGADGGSGVRSIVYDSDALFERDVARARSASGTPESGSPPSTPQGEFPSRQGPASGGTPTPDGPTTSGLAVPATPPAVPGPPPVTRDPSACYDLFLWADAQESLSRRGNQVVRRQKAMEIRLAAQSGDCSRARQLADAYKKQYGVP